MSQPMSQPPSAPLPSIKSLQPIKSLQSLPSIQSELPFRLLVDPHQSGARNMAVDEALLRAIVDGGRPVLRLYGFAPPCLSLGRFQAAADVADPHRLQAAGVELVRRPTGGRAVLHADEITYTIVLGRHHLDPFSKRAAYRAAAEILVRLLAALGVQAAVHAPVASGVTTPVASARGDGMTYPRGAAERRTDAIDPDCYRTTAEYEIIGAADRRKLVGSAQTMTRSASLQHGIIPLSAAYAEIDRYLRRPSASTSTPTSTKRAVTPQPSVASLTGRRWRFADAQRVVAVAAAQLGAQPSALTADEEAIARALLQSRYASSSWTFAR